MSIQPPYRYAGHRSLRSLSGNTGNNALLSSLGFNNQGFTWNDMRVPVNALEAVGVSSPSYAFFRNNGEGSAVGQAIRVDGDTGDVTIPYIAATDLPSSFSVSFWVQPDVAPGGSERRFVTRTGHFDIRTTFNQNQLRFQVNGVATMNTPQGLVVEGAWSHIVCVCEVSGGDTTLYSYIDGQLITSSTYTGSTPATSDNDIVLDTDTQGHVDELAIYNTALDLADVQALYAAGVGLTLEGDEPGLVALYHWDGDLTDSTANDNTATCLAPEYIVGRVGGTGSVGVRLPAFSAGIRQELFFALQLDHGAAIGTNLRGHLHWSVDQDIPDGQFVRWGLEFSAAAVGGIWGNTTILTTDEITAGTGLAYQHMIASFGDLDVAAENTTESMMLLGRVFRDGANDTFTGPAYLQEIDFHTQFVKMGSPEEFADDSGI